MPAPRRGDVSEEAVVGSIEIALGEVTVADRRARELPGQPEQEGLVDRSRDGPGPERPVPALQPLDRANLPLGRRHQAGEAVNHLVPGDRVEVGLHAAEVVEVVLLSLVEQLLDPRGPVAVQPVAGDVVGIGGVDDPVVGGDDVALVGIDQLGQLVVRDPALPFELARPAGLRQVRAVALPHRDATDHLVADRALPIGPDEVRHRHGQVAQELDELRAAAGLEHVEEGPGDRGLVDSGPAQSERLLVVRAERSVHDRAVVGQANLMAL